MSIYAMLSRVKNQFKYYADLLNELKFKNIFKTGYRILTCPVVGPNTID